MERRERAAGRKHFEPDWSKYEAPDPSPAPAAATGPAPGLGASDLDRKVVALEDDNRRLRAEIRRLHRAELDDEAIREILGGIAAAPTEPPAWIVNPARSVAGVSPEVPVTSWADWHAGEVVEPAEVNGVNEYNLEIFERRVRRLVETTIDLLVVHGPGNYPGIVINLLGDLMSGGLHPELLKTDEEETLPTVLRVRDVLVWALDRMIERFGRVYCACVAGNHGRATQRPEFKRYVFKNFDWLIYQLLARHYAGRAEIRFDIPPANEALYCVYGRRYLAVHGDMLGVKGGDGIIGALGPIARGEIKVGKQAAQIGRGYDMLLMGHWHQPIWLQRAIVANSLKGFDEFAQKALRAPPTTPSQPLWLVHHKWGETMHREVFVEDPGYGAADGWVSWQGAA